MPEIIALFTILNPCLSTTSILHLCQVVFALLAMTGRVTMLNISRWTSKGGSYRTIQRFYNTVLPWSMMCWLFFKNYLFDPESDYLLVADEVVVSKSGQETYGLDRYFSSLYGKAIPGLSFLAVSLVSVKDRRSYPMLMEQIVRSNKSTNPDVSATEQSDNKLTAKTKRGRGRPKGSRNRNKKDVTLSDTLKQLQTMVKTVMRQINNHIKPGYFVLDGYFGHNNAQQMVSQCDLQLISKLRSDAALYYPPSTPYNGRGRPAIYGDRFNSQQSDKKWCVSVETTDSVKAEVYQVQLRHKQFADTLNVVCILKTNRVTQQKSHVLLFSSDLELSAEKMIDYYSLRFQIEFNFRDAKQYWGLEDFMNVNKTPVNNASNLSLFMVNVSAKLSDTFQSKKTESSVLDLKAHFRGLKYLDETLKILPQKPEPIVIEQITQHLGSIGAIHHTQPELNPG
ncbi:transposase [Candidatus Poribacteria bacterium]|nr:transposase [Candidatus Poribacteria bacterium]